MPWLLVYPLRLCAAWEMSVPCPAQPAKILERNLDVGGTGKCVALPWITKDRRVDDVRNQELAAQGLSVADLKVLEDRAARLQRQGFASFADHLQSVACQQEIHKLEAEGSLPTHSVEMFSYIGEKTFTLPYFDQRTTENPLSYFAAQFLKVVHLLDTFEYNSIDYESAWAHAILKAFAWLQSFGRCKDWFDLGFPDSWLADHPFPAKSMFFNDQLLQQPEMTLAAVLLIVTFKLRSLNYGYNSVMYYYYYRPPLLPSSAHTSTMRQHSSSLDVSADRAGNWLEAAVQAAWLDSVTTPYVAADLQDCNDMFQLYRQYGPGAADSPWGFRRLERLLWHALDEWAQTYEEARAAKLGSPDTATAILHARSVKEARQGLFAYM